MRNLAPVQDDLDLICAALTLPLTDAGMDLADRWLSQLAAGVRPVALQARAARLKSEGRLPATLADASPEGGAL